MQIWRQIWRTNIGKCYLHPPSWLPRDLTLPRDYNPYENTPHVTLHLQCNLSNTSCLHVTISPECAVTIFAFRSAINHLASTHRDPSHFEIVASSQQSQAQVATRSRSVASPEYNRHWKGYRTMRKCGICKETGHDRRNCAGNARIVTAHSM